MPNGTDGEAEGAETESQVSQEAEGGQSTPSPVVPETPHEKIMAGVLALNAEAEGTETPATSEEESEETPAGETPAEGGEVPETEEGTKATPKEPDLQARIDALEKRLPGFQTAINEKHEELVAAHATISELNATIGAFIEIAESGMDEEQVKQFRQQLQRGAAQRQGRAMAEKQVRGLEGRIETFLGRLEAAGMKLEGETVADRTMSAGQQGIDIGVDTRDPTEALIRMAESVRTYEGNQRIEALEKEIRDLKTQGVQAKKQQGRQRVQADMAGGGGAANLGGATGPLVDPDKLSPRQKILMGIEAKQAAGVT